MFESLKSINERVFNRAKTVFRQAPLDAVRLGLIPTNPAQCVKLPRQRGDRIVPCSSCRRGRKTRCSGF